MDCTAPARATLPLVACGWSRGGRVRIRFSVSGVGVGRERISANLGQPAQTSTNLDQPGTRPVNGVNAMNGVNGVNKKTNPVEPRPTCATAAEPGRRVDDAGTADVGACATRLL